MSSPIRPTKDVDPSLMYAPRRLRDQSGTPPEPQSARRRFGLGSDFKGQAIVDTRRRPTLEPEWLPDPPKAGGRGRWRVALWMGGLFGFAALIALTFVAIPGTWRLVTGLMQSTSGSLTSINPKEPDALAVAIKQRAERLRSGVAVSEEAGQQRQEPAQQTKEAMQQNKNPPDPQLSVSSPLVATQPAPAPLMQAPEPSPRPLDFVTRQLPRDELASMLKRGDDFIKSGDLSSARLLLRRAAEAGDGNAALTLAGTFDPNVLKALGFRDAGDIAMARLWYERAEKLGSAEAPQRLRQLATINEAQ
jgi:hypothetical protein